jgi:CMP/dCMP kinase
MSAVPVIAIDGPSASGKGTVAQRVATVLGFHYLDSGAIYRVAALDAQSNAVALDDFATLAARATALDLRFASGTVWLAGKDVTQAIRAEAVGEAASTIAALPPLRAALLERQRAFRQPPGLVTDGRDMGSVVFEDAQLKVFLTAGVAARAWRRTVQLVGDPGDVSQTQQTPNSLIDKEKSSTINALFAKTLAAVTADLEKRDARDANRAAAPTRQVTEAKFLDTSNLTVDAAVEQVLRWWRER